MKFLVVAQLLFHLFLVTNACTEIRVTSEDESVVIGRSMEHMLDPKSHIIVEPKGNSHTGRLLPEKCSKPMTWQHKHNVAYVDSLNLPIILGGMNTAGLSVSALMFPGFAKYQEIDAGFSKLQPFPTDLPIRKNQARLSLGLSGQVLLRF